MNPTALPLKPFSHVILTGGSSGIGYAFISTILDVNDSIRICNLSRSVPGRFLENPRLHHIACDLEESNARRAGIRDALAWLGAPDGEVLLINNAGYGGYGEFKDRPIEADMGMVELNCRAVMEITHALLPQLLSCGGAVINVASTAAWQPTPFLATYGATKAFLLHWSRSLHEELRGHGVRVIALCPGPTESRFFERAGFATPPLAGKGQTAEDVARYGIGLLAGNPPFGISGWFNKFLVTLSANLPARFQGRVSGAVLRRVRKQN